MTVSEKNTAKKKNPNFYLRGGGRREFNKIAYIYRSAGMYPGTTIPGIVRQIYRYDVYTALQTALGIFVNTLHVVVLINCK